MTNEFFSQFPWNIPGYAQEPFCIKEERGRISRVSFAFLIWILLPTVLLNAFVIVAMIAGKFFPPLAAWSESLLGINVVNYIVLYGISVPLSYLLLRRVPTEKPNKKHLSFGAWLLYLVLAVGLMVIGSLIGSAVMALPEMIFQISDPLNQFTDAVPLWFSTLLMIGVAPFAEELLFRKLLIDRLHRYGMVTSILISALFFALFHQNIYQLFYAFLLGALLGYLYEKYGNYLYCVAIHFAVNLLGGVLPILLQSIVLNPDATVNVESYLDLQAMLLLSFLGIFQYLCMIACVVLFIIFWRKWIKLHKGSCQIPKGKWFSCVVGNPGMICALIVAFGLLAMSLLSMFLA